MTRRLGGRTLRVLAVCFGVMLACGDSESGTGTGALGGADAGAGDAGLARDSALPRDAGQPIGDASSSTGDAAAAQDATADASSGCVGLRCAQVACDGGQTTTLTGTIFDPAGKLPLYNVIVYVPNGEVAPLPSGLGVSCDRCDRRLSGEPIAVTTTDAQGRFRLVDVPAGVAFRIVVQVGKWRRVVSIPAIPACTSADADPAATRLPRNRTEGDIPRIAVTTGGADAIECLLPKVGLDVAEIGTAGSEAPVHLYAGGGSTGETTTAATHSLVGGTELASASTLWGDLTALSKYDVVILGCEGAEIPGSKPAGARTAMYDYAKRGGRVLTTHSQHYWWSASPAAEVQALATWTNDRSCPGSSCSCPDGNIDTPTEPVTATCRTVAQPAGTTTLPGTVNTSFPKGAAMKQWLAATNSLAQPGETLSLQETSHVVDAVTPSLLSWITTQNPSAGGRIAHQHVSFNTPVGAPNDLVCGRVLYTSAHFGGADATDTPFPGGCTSDLTTQQRAFAFMLFDLSSCILKDDLSPAFPK